MKEGAREDQARIQGTGNGFQKTWGGGGGDCHYGTKNEEQLVQNGIESL